MGENSTSESLEVIEHLLEQSLVGACRDRALPPNLQQTLMNQVPREDAHDAEGEVEVGGQVRDRARALAEVEQAALLRRESGPHGRFLAGFGQDRHQVELLATRPGPAP